MEVLDGNSHVLRLLVASPVWAIETLVRRHLEGGEVDRVFETRFAQRACRSPVVLGDGSCVMRRGPASIDSGRPLGPSSSSASCFGRIPRTTSRSPPLRGLLVYWATRDGTSSSPCFGKNKPDVGGVPEIQRAPRLSGSGPPESGKMIRTMPTVRSRRIEKAPHSAESLLSSHSRVFT